MIASISQTRLLGISIFYHRVHIHGSARRNGTHASGRLPKNIVEGSYYTRAMIAYEIWTRYILYSSMVSFERVHLEMIFKRFCATA
jgi:hypothetical protein